MSNFIFLDMRQKNIQASQFGRSTLIFRSPVGIRLVTRSRDYPKSSPRAMKKRILMISPIPSHPQIAGNRARIHNLALSIKELGHDLYFAHVGRESGHHEAMRKCWGDEFYYSIPYSRPKAILFRIRRKLKSILDKQAIYTYSIDAWYDRSTDVRLRRLYQEIRFNVVVVEYVFFPGH